MTMKLQGVLEYSLGQSFNSRASEQSLEAHCQQSRGGLPSGKIGTSTDHVIDQLKTDPFISCGPPPAPPQRHPESAGSSLRVATRSSHLSWQSTASVSA